MINLQYHKGQPCNIKPMLCQEGYCSDCFIYQSKFSRLETAVREMARSVHDDSKTLVSTLANR